MTESEWLNCTEPDALLEHVRDRASDRKFRLFICACCRRLLPLLEGNRPAALRVCEKALAVGERYADGLATREELGGVLSDADIYSVKDGADILAVEVARRTVYLEIAGNERPMRFGRRVIGHAASEAAEFARESASGIARDTPDERGKSPSARKRAATIREKAFQVGLLRDLFGPLPFRPVKVEPSWLTPNTLSLARVLYEERRFEDMPVLGDALEEVGAESSLVAHCREPGRVHVRGCHVVDLLLGKL